MTDTLLHADYCLPRPGEDAPPIESYALRREDEQGRAIGTVQVVRCIQCGNATYDGVPGPQD